MTKLNSQNLKFLNYEFAPSFRIIMKGVMIFFSLRQYKMCFVDYLDACNNEESFFFYPNRMNIFLKKCLFIIFIKEIYNCLYARSAPLESNFCSCNIRQLIYIYYIICVYIYPLNNALFFFAYKEKASFKLKFQ